MFKNHSPLTGKIWYTDNTEQGTVRKADAVAIAADMATAYSCDTPVSEERTYVKWRLSRAATILLLQILDVYPHTEVCKYITEEGKKQKGNIGDCNCIYNSRIDSREKHQTD